MSYVYILTNEAMPGIIKKRLTENPMSEIVSGLLQSGVKPCIQGGVGGDD
jgi:hypothetical protein